MLFLSLNINNKKYFFEDNNTFKGILINLIMVIKGIVNSSNSSQVHASQIKGYTYNKLYSILYNNLVCLADDFTELKGGLSE